MKQLASPAPLGGAELWSEALFAAVNYAEQIAIRTVEFCSHSPDLARWSQTLLDLPERLKFHLDTVEQASIARIYKQLCFSIGEARTLQRALEIAHFWTIEFIVQRILGPNPAFNFFGYDMHNDGHAWEVPAWLDASWYRQLVTPEKTPYPLTSAEEFWLKAPFLETVPQVIAWPATGEQVPTSWAHESLLSPDTTSSPRLEGSQSAYELARIGLRAQRRYRIRPNDWASRWSEAQ
ncbi:hypothetical protein JCM10908_001961 [Rhodotorula pacifica]|uniref:uncharacterized protein n=1 Tax=Rhodotorula pacifica TaxID=1495444 RepID=UPI00317C02F2